MEFKHISVLLNECIDSLNIKPDGIYVDGTAGGGGHSLKIAEKLSDKGKLICIDRDTQALEACGKRLSAFANRVTFVHSNFSNIKQILENQRIEKIDGILLDLGVSSYQLDEGERGFSYNHDASLDMRMDKSVPFSAKQLLNTYTENQIETIIREYGEEKFSRSIAKKIISVRENKEIETTFELVEIIKSAMPAFAMRDKHPAKKTFQAIRIAVNDELTSLSKTLEDITKYLNRNGRIAIISFHSLEDRIIKVHYNKMAVSCICPPDFPICVCNVKPTLKVISKKPILPSNEEIENNPRSKSAKLRVAEKV